jgi:hypothetical protein
MCRPDSARERDLRVEEVVLSELVLLLPSRLSCEELILWLEDGPSNTSRVAVMDAVQALRRCGLVRIEDDVVVPTFSALRATEILRP